jgi:hypothetical protein
MIKFIGILNYYIFQILFFRVCIIDDTKIGLIIPVLPFTGWNNNSTIKYYKLITLFKLKNKVVKMTTLI